MKNGTQKIPTSALLGYDTNEDGEMVIIQQEAEIVKTIYRSFVQGVHPGLIATRLNGVGAKTVYGNDWTSDSVRKILRNEKYCGDVLMQKTITIDYISHISKINEGEAEQYYIADHHDPTVSRELWNKAQELLDKQSWMKWKRREQQRLMPVKTGRLKGFISISTEWKEVSLTRLISATQKVRGTDYKEVTESGQNEVEKENNESEEHIMSEKAILKGFVEVELEESKGDSVMTLTATNLKFNKATAQELGFPAYVKMYIDAPTRRVAIEPCVQSAKNAVPFSKDKSKQTYAVVLKVPALLTAARKLADADENSGSLSFNGTLYPKDKVIIFDLSKGTPKVKECAKEQITLIGYGEIKQESAYVYSLPMLFIDDLIEEMYDALEGHPHRAEYPKTGETINGVQYDGLTPRPTETGRYCYAPVTHKATLGQIVDLLHTFHDQPQNLIMPQIAPGTFEKKLYSMYLSYLPKDKIAFDLKMNCDDRGSFTELLKTTDHGQFSVNISKPGITKGQHWHNSKWEFFIVVAGHGLIQERKIGTDEIIEFEVSGEHIQAVHMLPGYTHNIINLSKTENLVTVMWANEIFDPQKPDTFFEPV